MQGRKICWLVLTPVLLLLVVAALIISWLKVRPEMAPPVRVVALATAIAWLFLLWAALHRLTYQIAALWRCKNPDMVPRETSEPAPRFAIFYTTCDDLLQPCLLSCVAQDYPADKFGVFVCDDSSDAEVRAAIDHLCADRSSVRIIRHVTRTGFKAGNLNNAFRLCTDGPWDWIVIVDADQTLPRSYLRSLADDVAAASEDVCFIQSGQLPEDALPGRDLTPFQMAMRPETAMLFERDLPWRHVAGFYPFLGHGGAVRASAWERLGGFPECVSEDMAFTMAAHRGGLRGAPAIKSRSSDGVPKDFAAFVVRLTKHAAGAAELLRRNFPSYLGSRAHVIEKADLGAWLCSYGSFPLLLLTLPPATWLNWRIWNEGLAQLAPGIAAGFVGMFLVSFAPLISVSGSLWCAFRHWFWSFAVYGAALPMAAFSFVLHLLRRPRFQCTPKGARPSPRHVLAGALTCITGLSLVSLAVLWRSPFSMLTASFGSSQVLFPMFRLLHVKHGFTARLSRLVVWVPGLVFALGVMLMWLRGS